MNRVRQTGVYNSLQISRTIRIPPQKLHVGDIVDVAFNMVAVGKPNEQKAILLLRNITLLDATHTQVSNNHI